MDSLVDDETLKAYFGKCYFALNICYIIDELSIPKHKRTYQNVNY